jgi:hypothetical protein
MPKREQQPEKPTKAVRGTLAAKAKASAIIRPHLVPDIEELKESVSVDKIRKQALAEVFHCPSKSVLLLTIQARNPLT